MKIILNPNRSRSGFAWILLLIVIVVVIAIWMVVLLAKCAKKQIPRNIAPDEVHLEVQKIVDAVALEWAGDTNVAFIAAQMVQIRMPDFFVVNGPSASATDFTGSQSLSLTPQAFENWQIPVTNVGSGFFQILEVYTNLPPEN